MVTFLLLNFLRSWMILLNLFHFIDQRIATTIQKMQTDFHRIQNLVTYTGYFFALKFAVVSRTEPEETEEDAIQRPLVAAAASCGLCANAAPTKPRQLSSIHSPRFIFYFRLLAIVSGGAQCSLLWSSAGPLVLRRLAWCSAMIWGVT